MPFDQRAIYAQMREEIKHLRGVQSALLEALERAADCLEQVAEAYREEVDQARAAIAQAKGESK